MRSSIIVLLLALCCPIRVTAAEVRVVSFAFNLPSTWAVDIENSGTKLFATGSHEEYTPPILMAEACQGTECGMLDFREPFPVPSRGGEDWQQMGCTGAKEKTIARSDGITEHRYACSRVTVESLGITIGVSLFQAQGVTLRVTYMKGDQDTSVDALLDSIGSSMRLQKDAT